MSGFQQPL